MKNTGSGVLKCIVAGQRLDHDVSDHAVLNKRLYRNAGMAWNLVDIGSVS